MPTGTLTFQLPEEQWEFEAAFKSTDLMCSLHDLLEFLRSKHKYDGEKTIMIEDIEAKIWEILKDRGIDLEQMLR